ncbi:MAG TPA: hypothetical protein VKB47_17970 [Terracidiphilus sp.]|nr:hypothetical protein [Terracidiphilus sp.]
MRDNPVSQKELAGRGWICTRRGLGKHARYAHRDGWMLEHCGHATALTPWILRDRDGRMILTGAAGEHKNPEFGTAWPTLRAATDYVATITMKIDLSKISDADLAREWTRRLNLKRDPKNAGRKKTIKPCPYCGEPFGARDLRLHVPHCPKR